MRLNVQVIKYEQSISIRIYVNRCGCCESWEWGVKDMRRNCGGKARVISVGVDVLLTVKNTGVATASEIQQQVMPSANIRSVQRYLNSMVEAELLYTSRSKLGVAKRYYLTGKAKQLFGMVA